MPFELSDSRHLLGRSCPKPSWQKLKIFAVLPTAREMKNHPSDYLAKDSYPDFFLVTEIIFSKYLRQVR
jgi:hypothetical protein